MGKKAKPKKEETDSSREGEPSPRKPYLSGNRIELKRINNKVVKPMKTSADVDTRPVKGGALFPEVYGQVCLVAKKKSGKSVCIQNIVKECASKTTKIIAFVATLTRDQAWKDLKRWCKKHSIDFEGYTSIFSQGENGRKVNLLRTWMDTLQELNEGEDDEPSSEVSEEEEIEVAGDQIIRKRKHKNYFGDDSPSEEEESVSEDELFGERALTKDELKLFNAKLNEERKIRAPFQSPDYILIFDDLAHELKDPSIVSLHMKNRHFRCMTIQSFQHINCMLPSQLKNMDYFIFFKSLTDDKLQKIKNDGDLSIELPVLKTLYDHATAEPFSFLYIDNRNDRYRKKFDMEYEIH